MLKEKAFAGKRVVRLKGGDPLIFGRGADEIQYLRSYHIEVEIIPGISSATGIPSSLGIPLTARGISSSVAFLSGHEEDEDKGHPKGVHIPQADTLVFLMGLTKLGIIIESLKKSGWPPATPMMIIANGTKPQEQIVKGTILTIENLVKNQELKPPALIVVGKTVEFYKSTKQKVFLHCGTHPELYRHWGKILHWPMIDIKPAELNTSEQNNLLKAFESADIIVCTSWYAGEYFVKALLSINPKINFKGKAFAVIGRRTQKALQMYGIQAAIVSPEETAQGLLKAITKSLDIKGKRILFPRSSLPNPFLKEALVTHGAEVTEITIYENTKPVKRDLPDGKIDGIISPERSQSLSFPVDEGSPVAIARFTTGAMAGFDIRSYPTIGARRGSRYRCIQSGNNRTSQGTQSSSRTCVEASCAAASFRMAMVSELLTVYGPAGLPHSTLGSATRSWAFSVDMKSTEAVGSVR